MNPKNRKPTIRFKAFNDPWEQRKFGGLLESVPSKTFIKSPEINGKYEVVQQGNDPIMGYANGYPCEDYQETVIFGDHTLSLYKPQAPFFVATDGVRIVKGKDKSDGFFLFTLLEKYKPQSEGYKRYFSILSDTSCYFAKNLSEQQKIGEYFECINSLITLHQRKLDKLQNIKKACLEKMFPQNGESVPRIRFKGFTDTWEQRKLSSVATFINGRAYSQDELLPTGKYKVLRVGNFYTNEKWYYSNLELNDKLYANNGDLLYTWSATFGPHIWPGNRVIYHYHIWKIDLVDTVDRNFVYQFLIKDKEAVLSQTNGSTMAHITKQEMENKRGFFPKTKEEQSAIGTFLNTLDSVITLHQREHL